MLQLTGNNPLVNFNNGSEPDYIFRIGYVNNQGFVGLKNKSTVNFDDVPTDAWYYSYVASAVKN